MTYHHSAQHRFHELKPCKICGMPDHFKDEICSMCRRKEQNVRARQNAKKRQEAMAISSRS